MPAGLLRPRDTVLKTSGPPHHWGPSPSLLPRTQRDAGSHMQRGEASRLWEGGRDQGEVRHCCPPRTATPTVTTALAGTRPR